MTNENEKHLVQLDLDAVRARREKRLQEAAADYEASGFDPAALIAMVKDAEQWHVEDQPEVHVPYSLASALNVTLRDEGNNLLHESKEVNAQFVGVRFDDVKMLLGADLSFIDLCERGLDWAGRAAQQLLHSARNKAKVDPLGAYYQSLAKLQEFVTLLTRRFERSIYELVWAPVLTEIGYRVSDALLLERGLIRLEADPSGDGHLHMRGELGRSPDADELEAHLRQFGHVSAAFTGQVLVPRLSDQAAIGSASPLAELEEAYRSMVADLLEAYPVLIHDAEEVITFPIPGLDRPAYFLFTEVGGIAGFGLTTVSTPLLTLQWDGQMCFAGLPTRTLQDRYGRDQFIRMAAWLVGQVHSAVVDNYLVAIEHARQRLPLAASPEADDAPDVATYVAWVRQAQDVLPIQTDESQLAGVPISRIPQLRRNLFFKVLKNCGVQVEQGKGSEIKLLRGGMRPFLLGNHGYVNPTIPAFLAAAILWRLGITYHDWSTAVAAAT